jgi:sugar phosphate isomerase/epimerase
MHTRRSFLKHASALAGGLPVLARTAAGHAARSPLLDRLGVGLFTIPTMVDQDFTGTMKTLASIGYKEIETFGPYPWSAQAAQDRWRVTSQSLAFKGSGYFGLAPAAVRRILDDHGLRSPSMHTDLDSLRTRLEPMAEAARVLGQRDVVLPAIPASERQDLDGYRRMADEFNQIGTRAARLGLRFVYHNHGYGLRALDGIVPFEMLVERTDPAAVNLQMDLYWVTAGGADPVTYLQRYKGRYKSLHIKDMAKPVRFNGDGGDSSQWIALFPFITDAGRGVLDLHAILSAAKRAGVEHFFIERDQTPTPEQTLRDSYRYLSSLEAGPG